MARTPRPTSTPCATNWSQRLGSARAARVADTNRNLCIFPNLVINDGSSVTVRHFYPVAPDRMHVTAWALGPVEETEAQRARRLHAFLTFYGPGGFATPDDVAALEAAQLGFAAWREVPWSDLSRGMAKAARRAACDRRGPPARVLAQMARADGGARMNEVVGSTVSRAEVEDLFYHEADLLDTWRLDEWLTLLTDDATYYVPPNDKPDADARFTLFTIADDIVRLRERVIRLKDPNCHAEYPLSRTRRLIGNVRITGVDGDEISAAANFIIHRFRHNDLLARLRRPLPLQAPARRRPAENRRTPRHSRCRGARPVGFGEFYSVTVPVIPDCRAAASPDR